LGEIPDRLLEKVRVKEEFGERRVANRQSSGGSNYSEPEIVLDDVGERVSKPMPKSFLRDIDDLLF